MVRAFRPRPAAAMSMGAGRSPSAVAMRRIQVLSPILCKDHAILSTEQPVGLLLLSVTMQTPRCNGCSRN